MIEQTELPGRQGNRFATYRYLARVRIDFQLVEREYPVCSGRWLGFVHASEHRVHPGRQFTGRKGLDHIVVGPYAQPDYPVLFFALRGQHDQGHASVGVEAAAYLYAAQAGQHEIEHHQVGLGLLVEPKRLVAVASRNHSVTITPQVEAHDLSDIGLVVDDQDLRHEATTLLICLDYSGSTLISIGVAPWRS